MPIIRLSTICHSVIRGGNTVNMSREYVVAIDVSAEDDLRFIATGGVADNVNDDQRWVAFLAPMAVHSEGTWRYRPQTHGQTLGQRQK